MSVVVPLLLPLLLLRLLMLLLVDFSGEIKQTARRRTTKCKHKYKYKYFSNNNKATWKICEKKIKTLQHDNNNSNNNNMSSNNLIIGLAGQTVGGPF